MDSQTKSSQKVTRYRVTLDFTVDNTGNSPSDWNWRKLLDLNDNENERIKELYVENLGEIAYNKCSTKEAI